MRCIAEENVNDFINIVGKCGRGDYLLWKYFPSDLEMQIITKPDISSNNFNVVYLNIWVL